MDAEFNTASNTEVRERPDYARQIILAIRRNTTPLLLAKELQDYHESDIADAFFQLSLPEREKLYRLLSTDTLTEIIEHLEEDQQVRFINELTLRKAAAVFNRMEPDEAGALISSLDQDRQTLLMELLDTEMRADIALIDSYEEEQIGSRMTTNFIEVPKSSSAKEALQALVKQAASNDNIGTLYASDANGLYAGAIDLKDLIIARNNTPVTEILTASYPYVYGTDPVDDVIESLKDYNEDSIPVLGADNKILGVITSQDLLEVMDDEMGEDYARLAGLTAEEDLEESLFDSLKKRLPWLLFLLVLGLLVSWTVSLFEGVVASLPFVLAFQSLILGMSGNAGTQSLGVTIRVLMDDGLTRKEKLHLIFKEVKVGFVNGLILGSASFVLLGFYVQFSQHMGWGNAFSVSACIGLSLLVAMVLSSFTGTTIPLFFKKVGVDPAVASGPLITTMNDLAAVICYYSLVWLMLIQILKM